VDVSHIGEWGGGTNSFKSRGNAQSQRFCISSGTVLTGDVLNRERLQTMPDVANGQVDLEDLCSELRRKARCSETGVVVNEKDFNSIVSGLPHKAH
jgi:Transcription factor PAP1